MTTINNFFQICDLKNQFLILMYFDILSRISYKLDDSEKRQNDFRADDDVAMSRGDAADFHAS